MVININYADIFLCHYSYVTYFCIITVMEVPCRNENCNEVFETSEKRTDHEITVHFDDDVSIILFLYYIFCSFYYAVIQSYVMIVLFYC